MAHTATRRRRSALKSLRARAYLVGLTREQRRALVALATAPGTTADDIDGLTAGIGG